ncbi:hypothetical protein FQN57_002653 [Myotisia sp. PD_48]|nr:hypothetical protein FQN57_002653 [Myotisia sp. PD_48]
MHITAYAITALCAAGSAMAHMEMKWPYALRSKFNPDNRGGNIDYSMTNPLEASGSNFPCKGYHRDAFKSVTTYDAGNTYSIILSGSARHAGGSCQLSLSYDGGATFKVLQSYIGGCPLTDDWSFKVPSDAKNGQALLAWTWFNLVGNREMYMNCAQVTVQGGSSSTEGISKLPNIFIANVNNGCKTIEGKHTVFPNPGANVKYGSGVSPSTPPSVCAANKRALRFSAAERN